MIYVSVGYFVYDSACMTYYGLLDTAMIVHHTMAIIIMYVSLVTNTSAYLVVSGMFIGEVSNPPMHFRVVLKHLGLRYSKCYDICEIWFIVMYTYGRILIGISLAWDICACESVNDAVKFATIIMMIQSVYFVKKMALILMKRLKEILNRK